MFWTVTQALMSGLWTTFEIFILTLIFSLPLGLIFAFGLLSRFKPVKAVMNVFVWVIRGTPLMLQLIIIFYGPGLWLHQAIWSGDETGRITATVVAFVINYACYFSEIFRGGIESISKGQYEAGQVLGMTRGQIFRKVIFKQVVKRILPPMSNEVITLVKDTALANVIAIPEIIKRSKDMAATQALTWPLFYTAVFYLIFVGVLTLLFGYAEKKLSYFKA